MTLYDGSIVEAVIKWHYSSRQVCVKTGDRTIVMAGPVLGWSITNRSGPGYEIGLLYDRVSDECTCIWIARGWQAGHNQQRQERNCKVGPQGTAVRLSNNAS